MATINCLFIGHQFPKHGSKAASFRDVTMLEAHIHTHVSAVMHDPGRLSSTVYSYAIRTQCDLTAEAHLILYSEGWLLLFCFPSVSWFIYLYCSFFIYHGLFFSPSTFRNPTQSEMSNLMAYLWFGMTGTECNLSDDLTTVMYTNPSEIIVLSKLVFSGLSWSPSMAWPVPTPLRWNSVVFDWHGGNKNRYWHTHTHKGNCRLFASL